MKKVWWKSTTILINVIPTVLLIADIFARQSQDADFIMLVTAVLNIWNRLRVKEPQKVMPLKLF